MLSGGALEATQLSNESGALDRTVPLSDSGPVVRSGAATNQPSLGPEPELLEPFGPYRRWRCSPSRGPDEPRATRASSARSHRCIAHSHLKPESKQRAAAALELVKGQ